MLTAENIIYRVGDREILRGVSVRIPRGRFVGVVGPNGAGKTTLIRVLSGVARPAAGRVLLEGRPLAGLRARSGPGWWRT